MKFKPGTIYFLRDVDLLSGESNHYLKIGLVADPTTPEKRISQLQTGNPRRIICVREVKTSFVTELEAFLHKWWAESRIFNEWFYIPDDQLDDVVSEAESVSEVLQNACEHVTKADQLKNSESSEAVRPPTSDEKRLHYRYIELEKELATLNAKKFLIEILIKNFAGSYSGIDGICSIVERARSASFNKGLFERQYPELCKEFELYEEKISGTFSILNKPALKELNPSLYKQKSQAAFNEPIQLVDEFTKRTREIEDKHLEYLQILSASAPLELEQEVIELQLRSACDDNEGIDGVCSWSRNPVRVSKIDQARLKETQPEIYEASLKMPDKPSFSTKVLGYRPYFPTED